VDSTKFSKSGDEASRIARVLEDVRFRRASGESVSDETVLAAHPDLAPRLLLELRKLGMIQRARRLAAAPEALAGASVEALARLAPDSIPGYEILREIHRGSQGVVYHAIQQSTRREVAVKVMKHGPFADASERMRFEREVRVLSALNHPNIVAIHDSGAAAGHSYFVMNHIEGEPLDSYVERAGAGIEAILRLFVKICEAVSAAQICGVIHRDLKPGNVRIDRRGEPHVLDFGLAKIDPSTAVMAAESVGGGGVSARLDLPLPDAFTQTGQFVGSLPWASPEQAEGLGGNVDMRTDVYSLGVVLYQALTGRFPYAVNGSLRTVLGNIQSAPPAPPRLVRREINDEVETIVLKCLQKERERRYQSAAELSQDIQRYLRGEPIEAKRDSRLYVLRKHLRRHRLPVLAAAAVFFSLIAGIIATTHALQRAVRAEADALALAKSESRLREKADWELYKACLASADAALAASNTAMAKARLDSAPAALRGWEWRYLAGRLDQSLTNYDVGSPLTARFALRPDRRTAFIALSGGRLAALDTLTGGTRELASLAGDTVTSLALSPDGTRLALGLNTGEVSLRRSVDGREVLRFRAHAAGPVSALAFSPDGALLASGGATPGGADSIRVWESRSGAARAVLGDAIAWVTALAFRADGRVLASAHTKASAGFRLWDVASASERCAVDYVGLDVSYLAFSPDGTLAVASQDPLIRLYDGEGNELRALAGHAAAVPHVAFDSSGARLASASMDQTVRIWDVATGAAVACRRGHLNPVHQVAFVADDSRLLSISFAESALKVWDVTPADEPLTFDAGKYFVLFVDFSADGKRLYAHQRCWHAGTGQLLAVPAPRAGWETSSWLVADESFEWAAHQPPPGGTLLRDGRPLVHTTDALQVRPLISADRRRAALVLQRGVIQIFSVDDGARSCEIPFDAENFNGAAFSHNGDRLVTWTGHGSWTIWDAVSGREKLTGAHGSSDLVNATFSPDDRLLATASYEGTARIWDSVTGEELRVLRPTGSPAGDQSVVWSVAFSPDGTRLATGSKDRRIRLWDLATGQELFAMTRHGGTVMCLAWSPDGTQLASGGFDGSVCLWDSLSRAERSARGE
jgi:WD40 repeat protein/serine/threonine protein kinase